MNPSHKTSPADQSVKNASTKASASASNGDELLELIEKWSAQLAPLIEFHKAVEDAKEDDLRLYWDVRLVRGGDTPFAHSTGTSSLPGILGSKLRVLGPSIIEAEIQKKIYLPLAATIQTEIERSVLQRFARDDKNPSPITNIPEF